MAPKLAGPLLAVSWGVSACVYCLESSVTEEVMSVAGMPVGCKGVIFTLLDTVAMLELEPSPVHF